MNAILGIDVGGTFTDFVLVDRHTGRLTAHKQPSTPDDPASAVATGIVAVLERGGARAPAVELLVHGTTIALNAILQRRGARLALVVSAGNRDVLELARVRIKSAFDFFAHPDEPLIPRDRVVEVAARVDTTGHIVEHPTPRELDRVAAELRALNVDAVAVVLLNASANPDFEATLAEELRARVSQPVTASTQVWSASREYERGMVAVMNSYVTPIMQAYYTGLETRLRGLGLTATVSMTTSNGGSVDLTTARARPIDSILSGPASGVVAAIDAGARAGLDALVTFDMGGTSADIAVATGREPEITAQSMLGELPLIVPVVNVSSIGAGGGSIVRVDEAGFLKVGPGSAGAVPGPACFGRGGRDATITDCYLVCGFFDPTLFAEGQIPLSPEQARAAVAQLASRLGYDGADRVERTAWAALRVASSMMATEVRKALARAGHDPRDFTLVPFGGAGPTHAAFLADHAGMTRILVAPRPGIFCALGAALADLRRDFVHGARLRFGGDDATDRAACAAALRRLEREAATWIADVGARASGWQRQVSADLRYAEQAYDLTITIDSVAPDDDIADKLVERFHVDHHRRYGFDLRSSRVELRRLVWSAIGRTRRTDIREDEPRACPDRPARTLFLDGEHHRAQVMEREALVPRVPIAGPAIIEQADTTIVVPPGWSAERLAGGSLLMTREGEARQS